LEEIPPIAIKIFKYCNHAVAFLTRLFTELNRLGLHRPEVTPEIIRVEEEKHSTSGLVSNSFRLHRSCSFCKQETSFRRSGWRYEDPAFAIRQEGIVDEIEAQNIAIPSFGLIVISNQ